MWFCQCNGDPIMGCVIKRLDFQITTIMINTGFVINMILYGLLLSSSSQYICYCHQYDDLDHFQVNVTEGETVMSCMEKLLQRRGFAPSNFQVMINYDN